VPYRPGGRAWFGPAGGSWRRFTGAPADGEARAHVRCRVANWGHVIKPAAPALYAYFYFCTSCSGTWRPDKTSNVPDDEGRPPPCCELASILSGSSRQNQTVVTIGKKKIWANALCQAIYSTPLHSCPAKDGSRKPRRDNVDGGVAIGVPAESRPAAG
jgi:hypothetical protein